MSDKTNFRKNGILILAASILFGLIVFIINLVSIKDLMELRNLTFAGYVDSRYFVLNQLDLSFNTIASASAVVAGIVGIYKLLNGKCTSKFLYIISLVFPIMFSFYLLVCGLYVFAKDLSFKDSEAEIIFQITFSFACVSLLLTIAWFFLNLYGYTKYNKELIYFVLLLDLASVICLFINNGSMAAALTITLLVFTMLQIITLLTFVFLIKDVDEKPIKVFNSIKDDKENDNDHETSKEESEKTKLSASEKLIELKKLYLLGLLTDEEYEEKRKKYVDEL